MTASSTDRGSGRPTLSAIVIAFNGAILERSVTTIAADAAGEGAEVIVVFDPSGRSAASAARLAPRLPQVRWAAAAHGATVPQMRLQGIAEARGVIIGLLEDDCEVASGWCRTAIAAHRDESVAIGGAVEPGNYRRALDWAVYFCEYGRFMRPLRHGRDMGLALAGNNVTYKHEALQRLPDVARDGFYDLLVHRAWQRAGLPMRVEETLVVRNVNSWSLRHVTSVPYHHGRMYAAQRFAEGRGAWRLLFGVLALGLPVLKVGQVVRAMVSRRRFLGRMIQALPWIVAFATSWSIGEGVGYLHGAGRSASRWR